MTLFSLYVAAKIKMHEIKLKIGKETLGINGSNIMCDRVMQRDIAISGPRIAIQKAISKNDGVLPSLSKKSL